MWCVPAYTQRKAATKTATLTHSHFHPLSATARLLSQADQTQLNTSIIHMNTPKCCGLISIFPTITRAFNILLEAFAWTARIHALPPPFEIEIQWLSRAPAISHCLSLTFKFQSSNSHSFQSLDFYYYFRFIAILLLFVCKLQCSSFSSTFLQIKYTNDLHSFSWVHVSTQMSVFRASHTFRTHR